MPKARNILVETLAVIAVLALAVAVGGYFFLNSASFQRLAIRTLVQDVTEATGARAEIGNIDLHLSALTANLYNITLHGGEPASQPPLLHIAKLTVGLKIRSILGRKFTLSELLIERPVANLKAQGRSYLCGTISRLAPQVRPGFGTTKPSGK